MSEFPDANILNSDLEALDMTLNLRSGLSFVLFKLGGNPKSYKIRFIRLKFSVLGYSKVLILI